MMTKHKDVEVEGNPNAEERRSISCEQCPKKFVSKTGLRWHTKTKHDNLLANADGATNDEGEVSKDVEEEKKSHPCLHCAKGYMSIQALVRHTKESHSETGGEVGAESNDASEPIDAALETKSDEAAATREFICAFGCRKSYSHKGTRDSHEIKEHNKALKKRGRGKPPVRSTFHLSSQEEELVLEEGVADLSEVVDAEVEEVEEEKEELVANEEKPVAYISLNPLPADPWEEWRETQPIIAEEEMRFKKFQIYSYLTKTVFRFSEKLLNTKENAVENEMPILPRKSSRSTRTRMNLRMYSTLRHWKMRRCWSKTMMRWELKSKRLSSSSKRVNFPWKKRSRGGRGNPMEHSSVTFVRRHMEQRATC